MLNRRQNSRLFHVRCEQGSTLVEFAFVLPPLLLLLIGMMTFGIAFWNQITLTNATNIAAQLAANSRQQTPVDLCGPVNNALYQAGSGINNPNVTNPLTFSILVGGFAIQNSSGSPISSNIKVASTGATACPVQLTQGEQVSLSTTYGCNLNFLAYSFGGNKCLLSAQVAEAVQ
jgi:Flp pilus assembly protein TadG